MNTKEYYEKISGLSPSNLREYLQFKGWVQDIPNKMYGASQWKLIQEKHQYYIQLLEDTGFADYQLRTNELLQTLEEVEQRSKDAIISDILNVSSDVWKVHLKEPLTPDGMISLEKGVEVYEQIRNFFISGAASANDMYIARKTPQKIYPSKKADIISNFRRQLKLGQTEVGSYVITISADIQPSIEYKVDLDLDNNSFHGSFERGVNLTLAKALSLLKKTHTDIEKNPVEARPNIIDMTYYEGVTVNLCEAVSELSRVGNDYTDIEFECIWAKKYPVNPDIPDKITLSANQIKFMAESAKMYRENNPVQNYEARGYVYLLDREKKEPEGSIGLIVRIQGKEHRLRVILSNDGENSDYSKAVQAHADGKVLKCIGDLKKEGKSYKLLNPREVEIISDDLMENIEIL